MIKLNIQFFENGKSQDALLKIKDESLTITIDDKLIKLPYRDIKEYHYDEKIEQLTIIKHGGGKIVIGVGYNKTLFDKLSSPVNDNNTRNKTINNSSTIRTQTTGTPNYILPIIIFVVIATVGIIFIINLNGNNIEDTYLNTPLADCPSITLKDGLSVIEQVHKKNNIDFHYEIEQGKNTSGEDKVFLNLYNMYYLFNMTDAYVALELSDNKISISDFVYAKNGPVLGNSNELKSLLCDAD